MIRDVIRTFNERKQEIEVYFQFLDNLMIKEAKLCYRNGKKSVISNDLAQILRSNSFILIYNLAEYTITQAIEAIYRDIKDNGVNYDEVKASIKKEVVKYVKSSVSPEDFIAKIRVISEDIFKEFYPRKLFSGNVNADEIKVIAEKYGFSYATNAKQTGNGQRLNDVKRRRNELAHGFISFKECGQEYSIQEMMRTKDEILLYLEQILNNINTYIQNEGYRA